MAYGVWHLGKFKAAVNAKTASGTFVQHDDPVCILDGRKAMSNDHDGTSVIHSPSAQATSWKNHLDALRGFWNFGTLELQISRQFKYLKLQSRG